MELDDSIARAELLIYIITEEIFTICLYTEVMMIDLEENMLMNVYLVFLS